jgi:hypothetical protein
MSSTPPSKVSQLVKLGFIFVFCAGMFLLLAVPGSSAQSVFTGPVDAVVGPEPNSVVVADFNGDGLADIATANSSANSVTVVLQNSDGTFQPPVSYAVGNSPASLQMGDVNKDGKPDLLVVNLNDNTLSVLLGNGNGTFQAQKVTTIIGPITGATCCLAVADFNGDGNLDVAAPVPVPTIQGAYGVAILLGKGDGTFHAPVIYPTNAKSTVIAAADFNNDGNQDIAAGSSILLGKGDGTFQSPISVPLVSDPLVIADFNQDGNLDIATGGITILYGNGDGTFQVQTLSLPGQPLAAGDLNSDGKPDLVANSGITSSDLETLLNEGSSTFTIVQTRETTYTAVALAELKSGQPLDLLTANASGGGIGAELPGIVSIVNGNGDGTFATFPAYAADSVSLFDMSLGAMAAADFNGDGKLDLAVGVSVFQKSGYSDQIGLLLNDGAGFSPPIMTTLQGDSGILYPVAADFNGDGKTDLAIGDGEGVAILLGNGDGTFQPELDYSGIGTGPAGALPVAVGDFNNDDKTDVLGMDPTGGLAVILGNGNGTFGLPLNSPVGGYSTYAHAFAVADFNGDGKLDVAALVTGVYLPPSLQIMTGNGDGTFSIGPNYPLAVAGAAVASGDLNSDGIPDIVVALPSYIDNNVFPGSIVVFLGKGDGTFQNPITTVAGNGINGIVVSDFNGDGKQDVAVSNYNWADISLLLGNGDGTFQTAMQYSAGGGSMAAADFDGNGSPDLAVVGNLFFASANLSVLLSTGKHGSATLVSPAALAFGNQNVGQASAMQSVLVSNTNSSALAISGIALSGSQSGDYQQTNTCGTTLAAGVPCAISVTFTPQAAGARTAMIQITDSAFNSPQMISLSGTGIAAGFTFGMGSGGSSSSTISSGQSATFNLALTPAGSFSGTVNLTCSVTPPATPAPVCSVPSSVSVTGNLATSVTVTVSTTASGTASGGPAILPPWIGLMAWTLALGVSGLLFVGKRQRPRLAASVIVLGFIAMAGCGGSSSSSLPPPAAKGTPAGTYTATLTATSGSLSQQEALTVIVQ